MASRLYSSPDLQNVEFLKREISQLKTKLKSKDDDLHLAGNIGTGLLQEQNQLKQDIETLKQEKHSLQLNLATKSQFVENQATEIELQKSSYESLSKSFGELKKERQVLSQKYEIARKENVDLKSSNQELFESNNSYHRQISSLEQELAHVKSLDISKNDTYSEEYLRTVNELHLCKDEKDKLISVVSDLQLKLEESDCQLEKLNKLLAEFQDELQEKDKQIKSYTVIIDQHKEENGELMGEIEVLKLQPLDLNRKGNSLFAEVDDKRKKVEKEMVILRNKCKNLQGKLDLKQKELYRAKHQIVLMTGMISKRIDHNYIDQLENSLCAARKEIENLSTDLAKHTQINREMNAIFPSAANAFTSEDNYDFLRVMLQQSREKVDKLAKELQSQRMQNVEENEKRMAAQNKTYQLEIVLDQLKTENMELKLKIEELSEFCANENMNTTIKAGDISDFKLERLMETTNMKDEFDIDGTVSEFDSNKENQLQANNDKVVATSSLCVEGDSEKNQTESCMAVKDLKRKTFRVANAPLIEINSAGDCKQQ